MTFQDQIYEKMKTEYNTFIDNLKDKPFEEIIRKSYEIVFMEDILMLFENSSDYFDEEEVKTLLKTEHLFTSLYSYWLENSDFTYLNDHLIDTIIEFCETKN